MAHLTRGCWHGCHVWRSSARGMTSLRIVVASGRWSDYLEGVSGALRGSEKRCRYWRSLWTKKIRLLELLQVLLRCMNLRTAGRAIRERHLAVLY